jgi:DnaJ-class molecular chaperone
MHDSDERLLKGAPEAEKKRRSRRPAFDLVREADAIRRIEATEKEVSNGIRKSLVERGITPCPWCDGRGQRIVEVPKVAPVIRGFCEQCGGTGNAARLQGPGAEDWRRRDAEAKEVERWWRSHFITDQGFKAKPAESTEVTS